MKRALLAVSTDTPDELLAPVEAALALELEVARVDLGRVSTASGAGALERLDRLVKAVVTLGEGGERRLQRELQAFGPDVAIALDPGAAAALVRERDRAARAVPVIAVVTELAPRPAWAVDADRYVAVDDEAAVALADHGVDGARVHVVGALPRHAWGRAGRADRAALRAKFKLPAGEPVALVFAARLGAETLAQVALQLSLLKKSPYVLFDAGDDTDAAAQLRRQVPPLGLKAKLFGQIADAPELWRAADVVLARPRPRAVHETLACGCASRSAASAAPLRARS
jgi:UDP-N-acetylglucosamine:LPS N-acetylglucosamine transferase